MPFEAFKPVFKALPKLGFVGLAPALVITQCHVLLICVFSEEEEPFFKKKHLLGTIVYKILKFWKNVKLG